MKIELSPQLAAGGFNPLRHATCLAGGQSVEQTPAGTCWQLWQLHDGTFELVAVDTLGGCDCTELG